MTGDQTDDVGDLIRGLLNSIPPESFTVRRPTPVGESRFKQTPEEIDRLLAEERKARLLRRLPPTHAKSAPQAPVKAADAKAGRLGKLRAAFSIAREKARKRREQGPRARPGTGKRRDMERQIREAAEAAAVLCVKRGE